MKPYQRIKCRACGHFGHQPGSRCPLRNLVPDDRPAAKARIELAKLFPHRPDLVAALEAMQQSWVPKAERGRIGSGVTFPEPSRIRLPLEVQQLSVCSRINRVQSNRQRPTDDSKSLPHLASRLAERWGARVRA